MHGLPAGVGQRIVERSDNLEGVRWVLGFGKADNTAVDPIAEDGSGLIDFLSALLAEDFDLGLFNHLHGEGGTTMGSDGTGSSCGWAAGTTS